MARVTPTTSAAAAQRQARKNTVNRKYKVVFESVTKKLKKLHTVVSSPCQPAPWPRPLTHVLQIKFGTKAPTGYTFVPAGIPELTKRCKDASRAGNHKIFVVSVRTSQGFYWRELADCYQTGFLTNDAISPHVSRVGYHFVSSVAKQACESLGLAEDKLRPEGRLTLPTTEEQNEDRKARNARLKAAALVDSTPQELLDQQAHDCLADLFPDAPARDKLRIVTRAFKKASLTHTHRHTVSPIVDSNVNRELPRWVMRRR